MINAIITGNNVDILRGMPNDYVDLTVTSPPYDDLRTYKGYSLDFENLVKELYRITKPGGVVVWVVGDKTEKGSETLTSFKQALYFREIGFNAHDTMIYAKENWIPLTHNRYEQQFEYMFVFSKGKPKTFNPIRIPTKNGGNTARKVRDYVSNELIKNVVTPYKNIKFEKIKPNIWFYTVGNGSVTKDRIAYKHPAIFPEKLAEDHIDSWSNPGDIVLDPFGGSGTTAKMAKLKGRRFIHIDISEEYNEIARKRIETAKEAT